MKQISIFVQNKPGRLAKVTRILGEANVDIRALSVAEIGDFGIIRLIVDKPETAVEALEAKGVTVKLTEVLAVEMENKPGGLAKVAELLGDEGVNIEYAYAFMTRDPEKAVLLMRVDNKSRAENILKEANIRVFSDDDLAFL
jgi:hypothetical protein